MLCARLRYRIAAPNRNPLLGSILADPRPNPGRLSSRRVNQHHVRRMDRCLERHDPTLRILRGGPHVTLPEIHALDDDAVLLRNHPQHRAFLPGVVAPHDPHTVTAPDVHLPVLARLLALRPLSAASDRPPGHL